MTTKRSFFERLSGSNNPIGDSFDPFDDELPVTPAPSRTRASDAAIFDDAPEVTAGQLPVDVHQTANDIIVRTFVAGVRPDELSISISRDRVEISGSRSEREHVSGPDYFSRELFWGSFSRMIVLPQEIDVELATASSKDGLLTIVLPKIDKAKQTKLRVKAG
jgi:HSP20 family protein